jgi:hypothetical protein
MKNVCGGGGLLTLLLVPVLSQFLFSFMGGNLLAFAFTSTWHDSILLSSKRFWEPETWQ